MDKILIVDDNPLDRMLLREMLENSNGEYRISEAESGSAALEQMAVDLSDLVLLDIQMTDVNGFETLKKMRERFKEFIPVLLVSSFTGENDRLVGLEAGATDFINKPLISEEVIARVAVQTRLKRMYDDSVWIANKTNEGIKTLYKELEKKNAELQKLDQLKSDFVSTVSHELRTPLAITMEGLSLLLDGVPGELNEKQQKIVATSKKNIVRLNDIINDLLDISKIEAGRMDLHLDKIDVKKMLADLVESYQAVASKKAINLSLKLLERSVSIIADESKIVQVMNNLINNAIKFTPEGGGIEVILEAEEKTVQISVSDSGVGIKEEDMEKLFGKFQQFGRTHGPGQKGTGLGLAISKALVEMHDGAIWARSKPDEGTTFCFSLPLTGPKSESATVNV